MNNPQQADMEYPVCLICDSGARHPYLRVTNRFNTSQTFQLVQCLDCQFVYLCPRPSENRIGQYYPESDYLPHQTKASSVSAKAYQAVRVFNNRYKRHLIERFIRKGRILDYGCGTGEFLKEMKKSGWDTVGFEPAPAAAQMARDHGLRLIDKLTELPPNVSVITLWHVLEHVHAARHLLQQFHDHLDPEGLLCIAVPNRTCLDAKIFKQNWVAYDAPRHLYHFSPADLEKLLSDCGFAIVSIKSLPFDPWFNVFLSAGLESHKNKMKLLTVGWLKSIFIASTVNLLSIFNKRSSSSIICFARIKKIVSGQSS